MNWIQKPANLPWICGGLGLVGLVLRVWQLRTGFDEKGLLQSGHPAQWLVVLVICAAVAAVAVALWNKRDTTKCSGMFPASLTACASTAVGCLGIIWSAFHIYSQQQTLLIKATWVMGAAAAMTAALLSWCSAKGKRPHFLLRTVVTLYLMFHMVYHYQRWFSETQPALYGAQLLSNVLLILAFYHRTALEANLGGRKPYILTSQLAGFFCLLAIPGAEHWMFYGAMAVWVLGDAGRLYLRPKDAEEGV